MKINRNDTDRQDSLRELFKELPEEDTSNHFIVSVMDKVENVRIWEKRKSSWLNILFITLGVIFILITPVLVFHFLKIDTSTLILNILPIFEHSPFIVFVGFIVLCLLILDTLFQKYMNQRKNLHSH